MRAKFLAHLVVLPYFSVSPVVVVIVVAAAAVVVLVILQDVYVKENKK
jgi:hypothetical protein